MRRILLALVFVAALGVPGYAQVGRTLNLVTGAKIGPLGVGIDLRGAGITQHEIVWNVVGTVSGCSVKVEKSADGSSWSDLIAGATCTSNGNSSLTSGITNYVRVNATTLTGTGTLSVRYLAFAPGLPSSATIAGDVNVTNSGTFAVQVTSVIPGTTATSLGKAEDAPAASGDTGVAILGVIQATLSAPAADGDYTVPKLNANGAAWVQSVFVDAAEGLAVATNPVPIGVVYRTTFTALDPGDVGYLLADVNGRAITNPYFGAASASGAVTSAMTGTTSTSVIGGTASNYIYVTQCTTSNASTTVSTDILLQDGSGGTTLYVLPDPAASVATTGGGGGVFPFPVPLKVPTSGNGLFAANLTTGSSTKISCSGFKSTASY